jgi:hypothetical protein
MKDNIKILFLGDIVGRPGRISVKYFLQNVNEFLGYKPDLVIANCENASHGFGLTEKNYHDLLSFGIDILTSGNHIWDRKEIFNYIDSADRLLRPLNYPENVSGKGSLIYSGENYKVAVISILGRIFMDHYNSPWEVIKPEITRLQMETPVIIVDFHAEATAEKKAFGHFLSKIGVTAMLGTHTHVQTSDETIMHDVMAYITDAGYCGASESVIGMDISSSLNRLTTLLPSRYEIPAVDKATVNGVTLTVNPYNGIPESIQRVKQDLDLKKAIEEGKLNL